MFLRAVCQGYAMHVCHFGLNSRELLDPQFSAAQTAVMYMEIFGRPRENHVRKERRPLQGRNILEEEEKGRRGRNRENGEAVRHS